MHKTSLISALLLATVSSQALADDSGAASSQLAAVALTAAATGPQRDDLEVPRRGRLIKHHGYYAAPTFGVTSLDGSVAPVVGVRAAWLANHSFGVGFAFNALGNEVDEKIDYKGRAISIYGGLLLQYVLGSSHVVHGSIDTVVGGGMSCRYTGDTEGDEDECHGRGFFMVEPTANVEFNLAPFMRLSLGAGYRAAVASSSSEFSNADLSGFVGKTSLQFGRF
jgi:hypothetical protein